MSKVISSVAGTRTEPMDSYSFVRGSTATFKMIFTNNGIPVVVDTATQPKAMIFKAAFLNTNDAPLPQEVATVLGTLTVGQDFEYSFDWDIPANSISLDEYIITYSGLIGGINYEFGDEFFAITSAAGSIGLKIPSYATVDDIRRKKHNIDSFVPAVLRKDLTARNDYIDGHIHDATVKLREEMVLFKQRGNSENYRLFTIFYSIWSIMLSARGEDGSSVSDQNIMFWRNEWQRILQQEKREGGMQGIPLGRG